MKNKKQFLQVLLCLIMVVGVLVFGNEVVFATTDDSLVYVNDDWGKEEGNIIKSVTYEPNGDGTYKAHVSVDMSCVEEQKLVNIYGGLGYCWYDHDNKIYFGGVGVDKELTNFSYTMYTNLEPGKTWKLKVYLAYDYYGDEEWTEVEFQMLELTVPEPDPLVYVNDDWGKEEGNIIKSVTYEPNGDGTFMAHVEVDISCIDKQKLTNNYGGIGYYWYDHDNVAKYGGVGVDKELTNFSYTMYTNLEPGKTWKLKVYLAYDYYGDDEWREVEFQMLELIVPELDPLVYVNNDWGKKEGNIIKSVTYEPNGDGTFMAHVEVDISCIDKQKLTNNYGGMGYCWYDHDNKIYYGSIGVDKELTNFSYTMYKDLEAGKIWKLKVYLTYDYYGDDEWREVDFQMLELTVPEPEVRDGWINTDGKWYYYQNGTMKTGWVSVGGKWYYMNSSGVMQTGWVKVGNNWYYMNSSGVMQTGTQVINGKTYNFNSSGVWIG